MLVGAETFVDEVRDHIGSQHAGEIADVLQDLDIEGDYNRHAAQLCKAIEYVLARTDKSIHEHILALHKLLRAGGRDNVTRRAGLVKWQRKIGANLGPA